MSETRQGEEGGQDDGDQVKQLSGADTLGNNVQ